MNRILCFATHWTPPHHTIGLDNVESLWSHGANCNLVLVSGEPSVNVMNGPVHRLSNGNTAGQIVTKEQIIMVQPSFISHKVKNQQLVTQNWLGGTPRKRLKCPQICMDTAPQWWGDFLVLLGCFTQDVSARFRCDKAVVFQSNPLCKMHWQTACNAAPHRPDMQETHFCGAHLSAMSVAFVKISFQQCCN